MALALAAVFCCCLCHAQQDTTASHAVISPEKILHKADSLRMAYCFEEAVNTCEDALEAIQDSLSKTEIEEAMSLAQNGWNMTAFCSRPAVVARQRFSIKDFYLYYPLENNAWRPLPNQLDSLSQGSFPGAMFFPQSATEAYYSATDEDGIRNIYHSALKDTVWSAPRLVNEQLTSSSDEIFPMLSADGKSLYFASKGLYGIGGYDLYVSKWDEGEWGIPVNMGFPYSSPYDDYLFTDTPDGRYSMFASNRGTTRDSVYIYVLEYDSMPVRKSIDNVSELRKLAALQPQSDPSRMDNSSAVSSGMPENADTRKYLRMMARVRSLRDTLAAESKAMDKARASISSAEDQEKDAIADRILDMELRTLTLNDSLSQAVKALQQVEMEFLSSGIVIDPDKMREETDRDVVGMTSGYAFSRNSMGNALNINILENKKKFDYSFMVLPEGRFAEDNTLPSGLVYQIQIFASPVKPSVRQLKGLSPVFSIKKGATYAYCAGVFRKYDDVLSNLNKVKKAGFRNAFIVAFNDGKPLTVTKAKQLEKSVRKFWQIRMYPSDGLALTEDNIASVHALSDADLSKVMENGTVSYLLGPFDEKGEADILAEGLTAAGVGKVSVEELENE